MNQARPASSRAAVALILLAAVGLFAIRATAPHNFLDKDQERPASYILDVLQNGHWICQTDWMSDITSKPPMLTWVGALLGIVGGGVTAITLYLPSALAFTLLAFLVWRHGSRFFGSPSGLFAALILILSPLSMRLFILLRTDSLFALMVGVAAFAAFRAWNSGSSWVPFWLLAAAATLTKGPLGLVLAATGLLAALWEKRSDPAPRPLRGTHALGIVLYLIIVVGWFVLAYLQFGDALIDKLIRRELLAHAVNIEETDPLYERVFKPLIYFIHRVLPWSIVALIGFWRTIWRPAEDPETRRFERFLLCWFFAGIGIFSLTQHQRGDLLAPLLAPAALIAGRELARWTSRVTLPRILAATTIVVLLALGQAYYYYHHAEARNTLVVDTEYVRAFSAEIASNPDAAYKSFHYVDAPYTFQLYLGTMRTNVTMDAAANLLSSATPSYVVTSDEGTRIIGEKMRQAGTPYYELAACTGETHVLVRILGNRPTF